MTNLRYVHRECRRVYASLAVNWGFPRPITWAEVEDGIWVTDDNGTGIAWIVKGPLERNHWVLHAVQSPHLGLRYPSRELLHGLRTVASLAGATRLWAGLATTRPGWQRWLRRTGYFDGWDPVLGCYMDLEPK